MAFPESVVTAAWSRAGGASPPNPAMCECKQTTHDHSFVRCRKPLEWANRGKECSGAWEAHHLKSPKEDSALNCGIYCWKCHKSK
jgi:hypothetical protein